MSIDVDGAERDGITVTHQDEGGFTEEEIDTVTRATFLGRQTTAKHVNDTHQRQEHESCIICNGHMVAHLCMQRQFSTSFFTATFVGSTEHASARETDHLNKNDMYMRMSHTGHA